MFTEQDKEEEKLSAILHTVADVIITIDQNGTVLQVNPSIEKQFGYSPAELTGRNISLLMPEPFASEHKAYLARYLQTGKAGIIGIGRELVAKHKDGHLFPIHLAVSQIDSVPYFVGVIRDLSELVQLEKEALETAERERNRISRELHDELGQNLAGLAMQLKGIANQLDNTSALRQQLLQLSNQMQDNVNNIRAVICELATVELEEHGLAAALSQFVDACNRYNDIQVSLHCDNEQPITEYSVAVQLYRIAREAVFNALKHAQASRVNISLQQQPQGVRLSVQDDGKGLPADTVIRDGRLVQEGYGLRNIHYRAHVIGANLSIRSSAESGTSIECIYNRHSDTYKYNES